MRNLAFNSSNGAFKDNPPFFQTYTIRFCVLYLLLKRNVEQAGLQDTYSPETIAVSALLHDVCKVNFYKKGYRNAKDEETGQWYKKEVYEIDEKFPCGEHADKSIIIVQNFMHLEPEEILAIRAHMYSRSPACSSG